MRRAMRRLGVGSMIFFSVKMSVRRVYGKTYSKLKDMTWQNYCQSKSVFVFPLVELSIPQATPDAPHQGRTNRGIVFLVASTSIKSGSQYRYHGTATSSSRVRYVLVRSLSSIAKHRQWEWIY